MTEEDWLSCQEPHRMRDFLCGYDKGPWTRVGPYPYDNGAWTSKRKLRLIAVAFLWAVRDSLVAPSSIPTVKKAERIAEGLENPLDRDEDDRCLGICGPDLFWVVNNASVYALNLGATRSEQASLMREIVGNPWRPVKFPGECAWLTPQVVTIAEAAYQERGRARKECPRCQGYSVGKLLGCPACNNKGHVWVEDGRLDPARLCVLADALEEGGAPECLLVPLREGKHYRGFWVVDLLLGKE